MLQNGGNKFSVAPLISLPFFSDRVKDEEEKSSDSSPCSKNGANAPNSLKTSD